MKRATRTSAPSMPTLRRPAPARMKRPIVCALAMAAAISVAAPALAQQAAASDADLAKQAQNPIASLISLPFQNNTNFKMWPPVGGILVEHSNDAVWTLRLQLQLLFPREKSAEWFNSGSTSASASRCASGDSRRSRCG